MAMASQAPGWLAEAPGCLAGPREGMEIRVGRAEYAGRNKLVGHAEYAVTVGAGRTVG